MPSSKRRREWLLWIKQFFCLSKEAPLGAFLIQPVQINWMR